MAFLKQIHFWLKERLTIEEYYVFEGSELEMESALYKSDHRPDYFFNVKPGKRNTHVITPLVSSGIGMINDRGGKHITVYLEKIRSTDSNIEIKLFTTIRPENWVMMVLFPATLSIVFFGLGLHLGHLFFCGLFLFVVFGWFNIVYREQEETLIHKVKHQLKLRKTSG